MKSIIHFICNPDPRIGYGVCALNFKKELELILPNNIFQVIVSDPRDDLKFRKDELINKLQLVSKEEFEILKKIVQKQEKDIQRLKKNKKIKKASKS